MTTMFVQLRRVVYLLVLLQCCVCVAYAESGTKAVTPKESDPTEMLNEMTKKMESQKHSFNENVALLMGTESNCKKALNRAKKAKDEANTVSVLMKPLLEEIRKDENVSKNESESKELLRKAVDAAKEAEEAANNAKLMSFATTDMVDILQRVTMELHSLVDDVKKTAKKHAKNEKVRELAEKCMEEAEGLKHSLDGAKYLIPSAKKAAEEAMEQNEPTSVEAKRLQASINEVFQKYPKMKEELERERNEAAQTNANSTNTGSEGNKTPNENKEVDGSHPNKENEENTRNPNTNSTEAETGSHTTAQQQRNEQGSKGQNNKESKDETQEKNQNSQSNTPTDSQSSATGTSQTQNMPTVSPSSAPISVNNTQLSDSSSSPVLVHSPLSLLLVLMCVLGCTAVF
ncbi:uncharacterized protein TM35_000123390 [Trypanosoma theileri]|uniref:Mucin-associated surface protein (MASP) n=1 Tax=Trypanosoma theileri TaxID=67003 RepID=A0A1X0NY16_9TRYP|nr:uncharacterized protein TM35_000123390 [Trypanosoma theileri]ORC89564.1 hypothetical protein TM35_000123390 [Trypanosoma theileri]